MRHAFNVVAYGITKPYEERYDALPEWVQQHYGDRIVLAPSLIASLRRMNPDEGDVNAVYAAIETLATQYYNSRTAEGREVRSSFGLFADQLKALDIRDARLTLPSNASQHTIDKHSANIGGRKILLRHQLEGIGSQKGLHIDYAYDAKLGGDAKGRVVIGQLVSHFRNG